MKKGQVWNLLIVFLFIISIILFIWYTGQIANDFNYRSIGEKQAGIYALYQEHARAELYVQSALRQSAYDAIAQLARNPPPYCGTSRTGRSILEENACMDQYLVNIIGDIEDLTRANLQERLQNYPVFPMPQFAIRFDESLDAIVAQSQSDVIITPAKAYLRVHDTLPTYVTSIDTVIPIPESYQMLADRYASYPDVLNEIASYDYPSYCDDAYAADQFMLDLAGVLVHCDLNEDCECGRLTLPESVYTSIDLIEFTDDAIVYTLPHSRSHNIENSMPKNPSHAEIAFSGLGHGLEYTIVVATSGGRIGIYPLIDAPSSPMCTPQREYRVSGRYLPPMSGNIITLNGLTVRESDDVYYLQGYSTAFLSDSATNIVFIRDPTLQHGIAIQSIRSHSAFLLDRHLRSTSLYGDFFIEDDGRIVSAPAYLDENQDTRNEIIYPVPNELLPQPQEEDFGSAILINFPDRVYHPSRGSVGAGDSYYDLFLTMLMQEVVEHITNLPPARDSTVDVCIDTAPLASVRELTYSMQENDYTVHDHSLYISLPRESEWIWPLREMGSITQCYAPATWVGRPYEFHRGIDLQPPNDYRTGTRGEPDDHFEGDEGQVIASFSGHVVAVDRIGNGGFGRFVIIRGDTPVVMPPDGRWIAIYSHLYSIDDAIQPNAPVAQGATIGQVGNTGTSTGAHLHFEVYLNLPEPFGINNGPQWHRQTLVDGVPPPQFWEMERGFGADASAIMDAILNERINRHVNPFCYLPQETPQGPILDMFGAGGDLPTSSEQIGDDVGIIDPAILENGCVGAYLAAYYQVESLYPIYGTCP